MTSDNLIDNDLTTCEQLQEGDGCRMDKVKIFLPPFKGLTDIFIQSSHFVILYLIAKHNLSQADIKI